MVILVMIKVIDTSKSDKVGNLIVYFDDEEIYREDLFLKKTLKEKSMSFFEKIWEYIKKIFS